MPNVESWPSQSMEGKGTDYPHIEQVEDDEQIQLSLAHKEYLLARHGTLELYPMPSQDDLDPLNWPKWKKHVNLFLISFHSLTCIFSATSGVPAFFDWSLLYKTTITNASYISSSQMITLAIGPLLWIPIANKYGRRPVWILSVFCAGFFNIGCALSKSYGVHIAMSILAALANSPAIAMGQAVVAETFFLNQRGRKMGIWTLVLSVVGVNNVLMWRGSLFISSGTPMGPFIMGFVTQHLGWRWIYWILAIFSFTLCILYVLFSPETVYVRDVNGVTGASRATARWQYGFYIRRITPAPLRFHDFIEPLLLLGRATILLPVISYAVVFNFTLVLMTLEIPATLGVKFGLTAQEIGLNFLGLLIGCIIGEQVGGPFSDYIRARLIRRSPTHTPPPPEYRLWLAHIGFPLVIAGIVIFLVRLSEATEGHWNITPIIGIAIAGFGVQIVTTIVATYCSDARIVEKSAAMGVAINFVRCTWGFLGPFWFPYMFDNLGLRGSAALISGLIVVFSILLLLFSQWLARRSSHGE